LIGKIRNLLPEKISEVNAFVKILNQKQEYLEQIRTRGKLFEPLFTDIWNNPEDDVYDQL